MQSRDNLVLSDSETYTTFVAVYVSLAFILASAHPGSNQPDDWGNQTAVTDALGHTTTTTYDTAGAEPRFYVYPLSVSLPSVGGASAQTTHYTWDKALGQVTGVTDANGAITTYTYDQWGRQEKMIRPGDSAAAPTVRYIYSEAVATPFSPFKIEQQQLEQAGCASCVYQTVTFYDGLGQVVESQAEGDTSGQVVLTVSQYHALGGVSWQSMAYAQTATLGQYQAPNLSQPATSYLYDGLGRLTRTTHPDNSVATLTYTNRRSTHIDENGHQQVQEVDAFGRLVKVEEYTGSNPYTLAATTQYTYNGRDQLTGVLDAASHPTQIGYDLLGNKTSLSDPDMGTWSYMYDAAGNLQKQTDARAPARTTCFYYDEQNRLRGKSYQTNNTACPATAPATLNVVYSYDQGTYGLGRRTGLTDASGSTSWSYDARGRVTGETKTIDGNPFTTSYTYRPDDQVLTTTYPDGEVVTTGYNARGLPQTLSGASQYVSATTYNAPGQPLTQRYGNNVTTSYTYHPQTFRLTGISVPSVLNLGYTYYANGNLQTATDSGQSTTFTYDERDRLTNAAGAFSAHYTYSAIGNLITKQEQGGTTTSLVYPTAASAAHPHAPNTVGGVTYSYDLNGNTTADGQRTLTYDVENRLSQVTTGSGTTSLTYDGDCGASFRTATWRSGWDRKAPPCTSGRTTRASSPHPRPLPPRRHPYHPGSSVATSQMGPYRSPCMPIGATAPPREAMW